MCSVTPKPIYDVKHVFCFGLAEQPLIIIYIYMSVEVQKLDLVSPPSLKGLYCSQKNLHDITYTTVTNVPTSWKKGYMCSVGQES